MAGWWAAFFRAFMGAFMMAMFVTVFGKRPVADSPRFPSVVIGIAIVLGLLSMSSSAQNLTQAQQYFQQGREYHLGEGGRKVDLEKALRSYLQALRVDPRFYEAHVNAGKVYYKRKDYRRAKGHFSDAIKSARKQGGYLTRGRGAYLL
jgi:tetratricopeptide (TPR) repeat protein